MMIFCLNNCKTRDCQTRVVWYGNFCNFTANLYDTVKAGDYLGEVCDSTLYLVFTKGNEYLAYEDYLG